jgi:hypothetical protein
MGSRNLAVYSGNLAENLFPAGFAWSGTFPLIRRKFATQIAYNLSGEIATERGPGRQ